MTDHIAPLDVVTLNPKHSADRSADGHSPLVVLLRDFRDAAWLAVDTENEHRVLRIHDFIAHRYRVLGQAGSHESRISRVRFAEILQGAKW